MDLFRKKSVDQLVSESTPLKRTLKTFDLTMLGIGAIIGTGIFVLNWQMQAETFQQFVEITGPSGGHGGRLQCVFQNQIPAEIGRAHV